MKVIVCNTFSLSMLNLNEYSHTHVFVERISADEFVKILKEHPFESAVGHEGTAQILSQLAGVEVPFNRTQVVLDPETVLLVAQPTQRLPEGKVLSADELKKLPVAFFRVTLV